MEGTEGMKRGEQKGGTWAIILLVANPLQSVLVMQLTLANEMWLEVTSHPGQKL